MGILGDKVSRDVGIALMSEDMNEVVIRWLSICMISDDKEDENDQQERDDNSDAMQDSDHSKDDSEEVRKEKRREWGTRIKWGEKVE